MDFDLFEAEQDDDILLSVPIEPTVTMGEDSELKEIIPELECQGEDSLNSKFSCDSFIKNKFLYWNTEGATRRCIDAISITDRKFGWEELKSQTLLDFIFGNSCVNIQYLIINAKHTLLEKQQQKSRIYYQKRREITLLYHLLLHKLQPQQWPFIRNRLNSLRILIKSVTVQKQNWKKLCTAHSCNGNECNAASYHLLHGILEWKFLDLCVLHKYEWTTNETVGYDSDCKSDAKTSEGLSNIIAHVENFLEDLVICSLCLYEKKNSTNLVKSSPFPCTCVKEIWLLLQLALNKWSLTNIVDLENEKITFWMLFNKLMEKIKNNYDNDFLTEVTYAEFSNWLLQALVRLHGYGSDGQYEGSGYALSTVEKHVENLQYCEKITQQFLQANPTEEQLRVYIILITPIVLEWWQPKVNIPVLLWEYYHKKLNASFYVMGSAPTSLAVTCSSGRSYVELYRALLNKTLDINVNSYTLFTIMLGKCIERFLKQNENQQAQKLLGRIYSKFSIQKFFALSETGLHHLIELFIVLVLCGDFNNTAPMLRDKLLAVQLNNLTAAKQLTITKGHMALCILFAEKQYDLTEYLTKLLHQLAAIHNDLAVSKIIADTMLDIYKQSYNFHSGEHLLIGPWLTHFLYNCAPVEQERTLEALHLIFEKLKIMDGFLDSDNNLLKALNDTILPFVKEQYITNRSDWMPKLAADFCTQPFPISTDTQNFQKLVSYFIEVQTVEHRNTLRFLLQILNSERKASINPSTIIHIWLKSLVLLSNANEEVGSLTKLVTELSDFHYMTNLNRDDLLRSKEPLCNFIAAVGKTYDNCCALNILKRTRMVQNLNLYWRNFDKWLPETLNPLKNMEMEKIDATSRFYSFLAIVIYNCPEVAYTKSKISCFFHVAMTRYILPINIQMGKTPDGRIAHIVHKIWPVVMQGIGRLDFKTDAYLMKTISDLIQKWVPHFKISSNTKIVARPFIHLFQGENYDLSLCVVQQTTQLFLSTQRRQADQHACLVITILHEILKVLTSVTNESTNEIHQVAEQRLLTFVKGISLTCLEHIMMVDEYVPSRTLLLDLFRNLLHSHIYYKSTVLKELLTEHLRLLAKKHLAYYTFFYFNLLMNLSSIEFNLIAHIMDFLLEEIQVVEQKRGVERDNRIRECLQKLQNSLNKAKSKSQTNL